MVLRSFTVRQRVARKDVQKYESYDDTMNITKAALRNEENNLIWRFAAKGVEGATPN